MATHDYGFRSKPRLRGPAQGVLIGGIVVLALALVLSVGLVLKRGFDTQAADYKVYAASGAPCPQTTPARLQSEGPQLRYSLDFGGMTVLRSFGEADCAWISGPDGRYPICRLSSPGSVEVKAAGADVLYAPGIGRSAAVVRRKHDVACMITPRNWKSPPA